MKNLLVVLIYAYKIFISPLTRLIIGFPKICKFDPSCSEYSKEMINTYGVVRGILLGGKRIIACR